MRAVYQSTQAYLQLSKGDVNRNIPVMGQTVIKGKYYETGKIVGYTVPDQELDFYLFNEGEKHNQLTLTDPTEIQNMRDYIKRRGSTYTLIRELLFEEIE